MMSREEQAKAAIKAVSDKASELDCSHQTARYVLNLERRLEDLELRVERLQAETQLIGGMVGR